MMISIIVPVFKPGKEFETLVNSLLEQDSKWFEVLIINGGPITEILNNSISRLKANGILCQFIHEADNGIYDAMNKGIIKSKGEYLYFIGSDDALKGNILKIICEELLKNKWDMIYGNVWSEFLGGKYNGEYDNLKIQERNICHQAIFYNRNVFNLYGGYNTNYIACADWDFNLKLFFNENVSKKYIDIIIAIYGDGGFSTKIQDVAFKNDFDNNVLEYGKNVLTNENKYSLKFQRMRHTSFKTNPITKLIYLVSFLFTSVNNNFLKFNFIYKKSNFKK